MRKVLINRLSKRQRVELQRRRQLKEDLIFDFGNRCMTCGGPGDFRGISLSHIIPLSRGGKTNRNNCLLECYPCHENYEKHPEKRAHFYKTEFSVSEVFGDKGLSR